MKLNKKFFNISIFTIIIFLLFPSQTKAFCNICNHIIDNKSSFNPKNVNDGDIICIDLPPARGILPLLFFFHYSHPKITSKYILVTPTNPLLAIPGRYQGILKSPNLIAWFSPNISYPYHPKLFPMPVAVKYLPQKLNPSSHNFFNKNKKTLLLNLSQAINKKEILKSIEHKNSFGSF